MTNEACVVEKSGGVGELDELIDRWVNSVSQWKRWQTVKFYSKDVPFLLDFSIPTNLERWKRRLILWVGGHLKQCCQSANIV